ncbi:MULTISPECIES: WhiB family transcriptional regulator [Streptomyces]|uniref:WhiB family transcriptional regulator n=1 Tax=Streptomyces TaxID=1883 RepID=UPI002F90B266|nr:WhiB family transcriptional regulator [Streptomyces sp. NBC_01102]
MNRGSIVRTANYNSVSTAAGPAKPRPACEDQDPDLFFPVGDGARALFQAATAKAICRGCPLQISCLEGAFERGEEFGVWGGTDERDRRAMRRLVVRSAA